MNTLKWTVLILMISVISTSKAQNIKGEWMINTLFTDTLVKDYTLDTLSTEPYSNYGNHFKLETDGTFRTWYTAPCGNDCFITSFGKYVFLDSNLIQFTLESIDYYKAECNGRKSTYQFPLDFGTFLISVKENKIHLVKLEKSN